MGLTARSKRAQPEEPCACVERDRRRIEAHELHDAVAQTIFSVRLLAQQVGPAFRRSPEEGERQIEHLLELTRMALVQLRTTCAALSEDGRCHRAKGQGRARAES